MRSTVCVAFAGFSSLAFQCCLSPFSGLSGLVKTRTTSAEVRKSVCLKLRERNLTCGSVWPRLASKYKGSLPYVSLIRSRTASSGFDLVPTARFGSAEEMKSSAFAAEPENATRALRSNEENSVAEQRLTCCPSDEFLCIAPSASRHIK